MSEYTQMKPGSSQRPTSPSRASGTVVSATGSVVEDGGGRAGRDGVLTTWYSTPCMDRDGRGAGVTCLRSDRGAGACVRGVAPTRALDATDAIGARRSTAPSA